MQKFQKSEKVKGEKQQEDFRKTYFSGIFNRLIEDKERYAPFMEVASVNDVNLLNHLYFMCQDGEAAVVLCHIPDVYRVVHHHVYFLQDSLTHIKSDRTLLKNLGSGHYKKLVEMSRNCIKKMLQCAKYLCQADANLIDHSAFKFLCPLSSDDESEEIGGRVEKENTFSDSFTSSRNITIVRMNNTTGESENSRLSAAELAKKTNLSFMNNTTTSSISKSNTTSSSKATVNKSRKNVNGTFSSTFYFCSAMYSSYFYQALDKSELMHEKIYAMRDKLKATKKILNKVKLRRFRPCNDVEYNRLQEETPKFLKELELYAVETAYELSQMDNELCCFVSLQGVILQALECLKFLAGNFFNEKHQYMYENLYMCDFQVLHIMHMLLWQVSIVFFKSANSSLHSAFFVEQLVNWPEVSQLFITVMNISLTLNIDSCNCCGPNRTKTAFNSKNTAWQLHDENILESTIKNEVLTHTNSDKKPNHVIYMAANIASSLCLIRNIPSKDLAACIDFVYDVGSELGAMVVNLNRQNYLSIVTIFNAIVLCILDCHHFLVMKESAGPPTASRESWSFSAKMEQNLVMSSNGDFLRCLCQFTTWPFVWYNDMMRDRQRTFNNLMNGLEFIENVVVLLNILDEAVAARANFCRPILEEAHLKKRLTLMRSLLKDEKIELYVDECLEWLNKL